VEINATGHTAAPAELIEQLSTRVRQAAGGRCFLAWSSLEAAELGCDVYASDLNPVACC